MNAALQQQREDRMATRKQIVTGFLMVITVLVMLFFMTSDYSFSFSFRANSHPLKIKDEEQRGHPKFFGGEDVEVMVYEGKAGDVIPEELVPKENAPSKVIVINTDDEKTMEEIADEMKEEAGWIVEDGEDSDPQFPQIEINHGEDVKPAEPSEGPTEAVVTTVNSSTTEATTSELTTSSTTTPTPTTTTETTSTTFQERPKNRKMKGGRIEVKREINMVHGTAETDPQFISSSAAPSTSSSPTTPTSETQSPTPQAEKAPVTESPEKQPSESPESAAVSTPDLSVSKTATAGKSSPSQTVSVSQTGGVVTDSITVIEQEENKQSVTETPKTETVSYNTNSTNLNSTAAPSNDSRLINNHHNQDTVVIEHNDLLEEFLSDDSDDNSFV